MLVNRDDGAMFDHCLVCVIVTMSNVPVNEGNDVLSEHVGARGLACSLEHLEVIAYVSEGLFWVFLVPLGPVLLVEIIIVISLTRTLEVYVVDILICDCVKHGA